MKPRKKKLTAQEARDHMRAGGSAYPEGYVDGWKVVYYAKLDKFYAINPYTGSDLEHSFRDTEDTAWYEGVAPRRRVKTS